MDTCKNKMTADEYSAYWLEETKKIAENDNYIHALLKTATEIIDKKDYRYLYGILLKYDETMKKFWKSEGIPTFDGLPFWVCPLD